MKTLLASALLVLFAMPVLAQDPAAPSRAAMQKLAFLHGRWEGEGQMRTGPGEPHTARVVETVQSKLDGTVLLVEGVGRAEVGGAERVVHNALGVISYDPAGQAYRMRAFLATGQTVDPEIEVSDGEVVWRFQHPQAGLVRYTIRLTEQGQWNEQGHYSRDGGQTWSPFFEMTLSKVE